MSNGIPELPRNAHVFIDETKARDFILVATWLTPLSAAAARRRLRTLVPSGPMRIHFKKLTDRQRRAVLASMHELKPIATVARVPGSTGIADRERALRETLRWCQAAGASRIVIERDDSYLRYDLMVAKSIDLAIAPIHLRGADEACLWISDAIAWCLQRGGVWSDRVLPFIFHLRARNHADPDRRP